MAFLCIGTFGEINPLVPRVQKIKIGKLALPEFTGLICKGNSRYYSRHTIVALETDGLKR